MWVLVGLLVGCVHTGLPMPGHPRFVGGREWTVSVTNVPDVAEATKVAEVAEVNESSTSDSERSPLETIDRNDTQGLLVAKTALQLKGRTKLKDGQQTFRYDCSGFVMAAYTMAGLPLSGSTRTFFKQAQEQGRLYTRLPTVGDVAFFDHTYDRNKNGKRDDELSHIAIVVDVQSDGTIQMVHLGSTSIVDLWMNLDHPSQHKSPDGKLWNSYLRVNRKGDTGPNLTGELFRSFGELVID